MVATPEALESTIHNFCMMPMTVGLQKNVLVIQYCIANYIVIDITCMHGVMRFCENRVVS